MFAFPVSVPTKKVIRVFYDLHKHTFMTYYSMKNFKSHLIYIKLSKLFVKTNEFCISDISYRYFFNVSALSTASHGRSKSVRPKWP